MHDTFIMIHYISRYNQIEESHNMDTTTGACLKWYNNMRVWILVGKGINFSIAAGLIMLHMPGVK